MLQTVLKASKCDFFAQEILYLGFRISGTGIKPDAAKTQVIQNWPKPCNINDIGSFLGFVNYHRDLKVNCDTTIHELLQIGKNLFFLNGQSPKGPLLDFNLEKHDFKNSILIPTLTVRKLYDDTKVRLLRVYMATTPKKSRNVQKQVIIYKQKMNIIIV